MNNDIVIKEYAPVIIPTLCRYEHFKACIKSLQECTHADKTDVYIGLDYPAKEEHWNGYRKISEFLNELEDNHNFKNLIIIRRERNYGLGINGNYTLLRKQVLETRDTYIASEDDNIFSKAFLDYCNKGLVKFKDNKNVMAICGYRNYYPFKFSNNSFAKQGVDYVAWGYASWKDRLDIIESISPGWFRHQFSLLRFYRFCRSNGNYRALCWLQHCLRPINKFIMYDDGISVYMGLTGKYTIMPVISLVKNIGIDGSGWHFNKNTPELRSKIENQELYKGYSFDYHGTGDEFYQENMDINVKYAYKRISALKFPLAIINMLIGKFLTAIRN